MRYRQQDRREDRYRREDSRYRREDSRYSSRRNPRMSRNEQHYYEDEPIDRSDTVTGGILNFLTELPTVTKKKQKRVLCNNLNFQSTKLHGSYQNLKTGDIVKIDDERGSDKST